MMRARRTGLLLITVLIISSTIIYNLHALAEASGPKNARPAPTSTEQSTHPNLNTGNSEKTQSIRHKITAKETEAIKSQVGFYEEGKDYNNIVAGHGTGLQPPTAAEWQEISENAYVVDRVNYQSSATNIDNSVLPWFPPIGNQDGEGSCVAWSVAYYIKTFQEAKEHGWDLSGAAWVGGYAGYPTPSYQDKIMSPEFVYHLTNNGVDEGSSFQEAVNLVSSIGVSSWEKMPYDRLDHTTWPSEQAWAEAPLYRGNSSGIQYMDVDTDLGLANLKNWIASEHLAIVAINASYYPSLTSNDVWTLDNYNPPGLNHANTIVGYDDNFTYTESGQTSYGAFKIANSWGVGGWEKVSDGFYWISYEVMKQRVNRAMFFHDLVDYTPELTTTFELSHDKRGETQIIVGLGNPNSPITTKSFSQYISGGSVPFPSNNIVLDITEFKNYVPSLYNQSYFLGVRDTGTATIGNVTRFAIGNKASLDVPRQTIQNSYVYVSLVYAVTIPELAVSPNSGPGGSSITLSGFSFTASNSANLSYLNPVTSRWVSLVNGTATTASGQLTYNLNAPDLLLGNSAGDSPSASDNIVFRAQDNGSGLSCNTSIPYSEWRRGLARVGNAIPAGLYGNNTNLTSSVVVAVGQTLVVAGAWFNPGDVTILLDDITAVGTALADETGFFNATVTMPTTTAGQHYMVVEDENARFVIAVARMPSTAHDYDSSWRNADFTVNLSPDPSNAEIYYRINGGSILHVSAQGQPRMSTESINNMLEYWSVDELGNEENPHKTLTQIKLDKTPPTGSIQINDGASYTTFATVTLAVTAADATSGVYQVRFSNDGSWDTETWEPLTETKLWTLTPGDGMKTIFYQVKDNAGLESSFSDSITVDRTSPAANAGRNQTVNVGSNVTFDASNSTDASGIISYDWNFGDGTNGTGKTVTHTYSASGTYLATLSVHDAAGNTAMSTVTVTVRANMLPEFPQEFFAIPFMGLVTLVFLIVRKKASNLSREKSH